MYNLNCLIAVLIFCCSFNSSDEIESKVIKTAQDNLASSLSKIPKGKESLYGFKDSDEFDKCSIGKPYRMITLNDAFFSDEILTNKNYFLLQNEWRVPVMVKNESRLLLTVINQSETYNVVDLGGMELAKELEQTIKNFNPSGERFILRIYPLTVDFLVTTETDLANAQYIPLTSALMGIEALKNNSKSEYSLQEVFQFIKEELKNHPKN